MANECGERRRITVVLEECVEPPGPPMWVVSSPELPELHTEGMTVAGALAMAADAVRLLGLNAKAGATPAAT